MINLDCKRTLIFVLWIKARLCDVLPVGCSSRSDFWPSGSQQLPNKMTGKYTTLIMMIMTPVVFLVTMPILLIMTVMMTDMMMMMAIMAALALSMLLMMLEMSVLIRPQHFLCACMPPDNSRVSQRGWPGQASNLRHLAVRHPLPTSCLFAGS